jgi:hypothetical protein
MKAIIIAILTLAGISVFAADSGCGLGEVIIQRNSKVLQLFSWTTNGILFTQPLGITSGTSGCSANGLVQNNQQIEYFVEVNHDDLSREMAQGSGEKLSVLAQLNGCVTPEAQAAFASMTQASFNKILPTAQTTAASMVQNLKKEAQADQKTAQMCRIAAN